MNCEQLVELLVEYVDGDLDRASHAGVESHLAACPDCQHFVNTYAATIQLAERAFTAELPEDVKLAMERELRTKIGELA